MYHHLKLTFAAVSVVALLQPALAQSPAEKTLTEIEQTFGFVPEFMAVMPEHGVASVWAMMKELDMNPDTALSAKEKTLIGLAVAAQIPCQYCIYAYAHSAKAQGIGAQEIREAVGMAAYTRMGSTLLNGLEVDLPNFKTEFDLIVAGE